MAEREVSPRHEGEDVYFRITCEEGRQEETIELLEQLEGVTVFPPTPARQLEFLILPETGEVVERIGRLVEGLTDDGKVDAIVHTLADRRIAAYSRETQVHFFRVKDIVQR